MPIWPFPGGLVLNLAVQNNWMLRIVAFSLVSAGALGAVGVPVVYPGEHCSGCVHGVLARARSGRYPGGTTPHRAVLHRPCAAAAHRLACC